MSTEELKNTLLPSKEIDGIRFYDLKELSEKLGTQTRNLASYIKRGRLRAVKVANKWIVSEDNLREFLNGR